MEIEKASSPEFHENLAKLLATESLLKEHQSYSYSDPELVAVLEEWRRERKKAK